MTTPLPINAGTVPRRRGDTKPFRLTILDEADVDVPLGGFTFKLTGNTIKEPVDITDQLFELTGTAPADGQISFPWSAPDADQLGVVFFDVELIDASSVVTTIAQGKFKFIQDITK